ncbi:unnamed protein product [Closterium sp. NIES-54]
MVTTTTPGGQRVSICTYTRTGRHLATFTRRPGSSLYTLDTEPPHVAASAQTLLWHHRLGHPSLPRLRGVHSRLLVFGLPRSLPPLPPSPAPPCLPCVEGRQRAAPHSSFPPTTAPLQNIHMDVWGPARVSGQGRGRYFLLVVDDYKRYTTVFPLCSKGEVPDVLIPWIRAVRLQLREWFRQDLPILHLHSDQGGDFSSDLLRDFCRGEGILQSFTLSDSPQQNGIAERRIGESGGAAPRGTTSYKGLAGASPQLFPRPEPLSPQQLREWFAQCTCLRSGAGGAGVTAGAGGTGDTAAAGPGGARTGGTGAAGTGGVGGAGAGGAGAGDPAEPGGARAGGAGAGGTGAGGGGDGGAGAGDTGAVGDGAGGTGAGGAGAGGAGAGYTGAVDPEAGGASAGGAVSGSTCAGGTVRPRQFFVPLLHQSRPTSPICAVRTGRRVPRPCPPPVPGTHAMALRPSSVPLRVPLLAPPESSVPGIPNPESDLARAASPIVSRLLATVVTDPSFESIVASALIAELVDFAAAYRLDYTTTLIVESESASPPSVAGEYALGTDVLEDRQEDFECLAAAVPRFASMLLAPEGDPDAPDILTPRCYAEAITVPPCGANIVDGMWIFRVKRPPGSPPAFKARYVSRGFSQRQGVEYFQTFSPTPKMTTLWVSLHVAAQRDYELHSLVFSTAFLQGSLHEEIWLRRPPGFTGSFPAGTQWSLRRPVYGLRQAPHEWHDTLRTTLAALGFTPSTADLSLFLRTDTSLPLFNVLVYVDDLLSWLADHPGQSTAHHHPDSVTHGAPGYLALRLPVLLATAHSSVYRPLALSSTFGRVRRAEWSVPRACGRTTRLALALMYLMTCTRSDLTYPLSLLARYVAPGRHQKVHWDAAKRVLHYLCSMSGLGLVLGGRGPVVLTGHADTAWVDDLATQRSSQGYTFSLGPARRFLRATAATAAAATATAATATSATATAATAATTAAHLSCYCMLRRYGLASSSCVRSGGLTDSV